MAADPRHGHPRASNLVHVHASRASALTGTCTWTVHTSPHGNLSRRPCHDQKARCSQAQTLRNRDDSLASLSPMHSAMRLRITDNLRARMVENLPMSYTFIVGVLREPLDAAPR